MVTPRLELAPWIGQRQATFRFVRIDGPTGVVHGDIQPLRDNPAQLSHDTGRTVKRSLSLEFGKDDTAAINPIRDRILVSMIIGSTEFPLGRYMFTDETRVRFSNGDLSNCSLVDEMFIVDQPIERGFTARQTVDQSIRTLLDDVPQITYDIESSGLLSTGSWAAGTSRAKIIEELAVQGGYYSPWMDNNGIFRMIQAFDPADALPSFDFDASNRVVRGSIAMTDDLLTAPNKFVVISNGATGGSANAPATGVYFVPNSAPHSIINRGFVIPDVRDIQLTSPSQAQTAARTIGLSSTVFERTELDTSPDPRHDSYDVITWDGELWLELGWSLPLSEGAPMHHTMRKAYS